MEQFENEPLTDFRSAENRRRMQEALQAAREGFGRKYSLVIGGRDVWTAGEILSINPARPSAAA